MMTRDDFSIDDLIQKIHSSPTLSQLLMERMDRDYAEFKSASEQTLSILTDIVTESLLRTQNAINELTQRMEALESKTNENPVYSPVNSTFPRRIRWGSSPEEIKQTVFEQVQRLQLHGKDVCVDTIKNEVPGMLRWLYGDKAVFNGLKGLHKELRTMGIVNSSVMTPSKTTYSSSVSEWLTH